MQLSCCSIILEKRDKYMQQTLTIMLQDGLIETEPPPTALTHQCIQKHHYLALCRQHNACTGLWQTASHQQTPDQKGTWCRWPRPCSLAGNHTPCLPHSTHILCQHCKTGRWRGLLHCIECTRPHCRSAALGISSCHYLHTVVCIVRHKSNISQ